MIFLARKVKLNIGQYACIFSDRYCIFIVLTSVCANT